MRAFVITEFPPLVKAFAARGNLRRFSLFMAAIRDIADAVDILHLWPSEDDDLARLDREQSERFGMPVSTHIVPARNKSLSVIDNYVIGSFSVFEQDQFFRFCDPSHVAQAAAILDRQPDVVFIHRLTGMLPVIRAGRRPHRMFFDLDDLEHLRRVQTAREQPTWTRAFAHLARVPAVIAAERRAAALSRATFICSELDRIRLRRLRVARPTVIHNAVPVPWTVEPVPAAPRLLFVGYSYYQANIDAAERLVRYIFPRVRATIPNAELLIAGDGTDHLPSRRDSPVGVHYLGYVDDLAALYGSARMVCCPVTYGTGTRMKLIEAGAYGRPMVATQLAAEGLDFGDGYEILLRDTDVAFADACVRVLSDDWLACQLGAAARRRVQQRYDEAVVRRAITALMSKGWESTFEATLAPAGTTKEGPRTR
jgi:glycosyltransferase involved in cell wall biosynthesis